MVGKDHRLGRGRVANKCWTQKPSVVYPSPFNRPVREKGVVCARNPSRSIILPSFGVQRHDRSCHNPRLNYPIAYVVNRNVNSRAIHFIVELLEEAAQRKKTICIFFVHINRLQNRYADTHIYDTSSDNVCLSMRLAWQRSYSRHVI